MTINDANSNKELLAFTIKSHTEYENFHSESMNQVDQESGCLNAYGLQSQLTELIENSETDSSCAVIAASFRPSSSITQSLGTPIASILSNMIVLKFSLIMPKMIALISPNVYIIVFDKKDYSNGLLEIIDNLQDEFTSPIHFGDQDIILKPYLGISISPEDGENAKHLIDKAVVASDYANMQQQKVVVFNRNLTLH